jgi:hypothetical protein
MDLGDTVLYQDRKYKLGDTVLYQERKYKVFYMYENGYYEIMEIGDKPSNAKLVHTSEIHPLAD